jgi:hypothetical protein
MLGKRSRGPCLATTVFLATTLVSNVVFGDVLFAPLRPAICPATNFDVMTFRSEEFPELGTGNYKDFVRHSRGFIANGWTSQVTLRNQAFNTELNYDFVRLGTASNQNQHVLSGDATGDRTITSTGSLQGDPGLLRWDTDLSVQKPGFNYDAVSTCSQSSQTTVDTATGYFVGGRVNGVLRGQNDVVYLRSGNFAGIDHLAITLRRMAAVGDLDLYARCGSLPTPTNFDYRSFSGDTEEFLDVTCTTSTIYIAVHAYSGGGSFALNLDPHWTSSHKTLKAGTDTVFNGTDFNAIWFGLQKGARYTFGATDGTLIIDQIDLYNSGDCNNCGGSVCNVCAMNATGRSNADKVCTSASSPGRVFQKRNAWGAPEVWAHEWGHALYCCGDEYDEPMPNVTRSQCGHSIMAHADSPGAGGGGLIEGDGGNHNICYSVNHTKNPDPAAAATSLTNCNQQAKNAGVIPFSWTQPSDNFPFVDVDFNLAVGNVIAH